MLARLSSSRGPLSRARWQLQLLSVAMIGVYLDMATGFQHRYATMADMLHHAEAGQKANKRHHGQTMGELLSQGQEADDGVHGESADHPVVAKSVETNANLNDTGLSLLTRMDAIWDSTALLREQQRLNATKVNLTDVDVDGDGVVSMKEVQKLRDDNSPYGVMMQLQRFRAADANGDRVLQFSEFHEFLHADMEEGVDFREFRRLEKAGGLEVADEKAAEQEFQLHDDNDDGLLNRAEFDNLISGHQLFRPHTKPQEVLTSAENQDNLLYTSEVQDAIHKLLNHDFGANSYFNVPMKGILRSEV
eukprot:gnl/TRDRNA2_/TRDRNA2_185254_c0_seq1.p1 gnl/TRDRNA2_/TRDRNA2_185254_c0~~gnl/TRDRNA2_/TRDRNA2_185254_c0_seq1.p1  ORF type:complete len:305 (+),score=60.34 gnl/TRDRNA2_/TRDRNA2_185254_c0_seq1:94-1008(+)